MGGRVFLVGSIGEYVAFAVVVVLGFAAILFVLLLLPFVTSSKHLAKLSLETLACPVSYIYKHIYIFSTHEVLYYEK